MQTGFIQLLILIIIAVVLGGAAGYAGVFEWHTDLPNDIGNLPPPAFPASAEYRNDAYGLLVSLPEGWEGFRDIGQEGEGAAWHGIDIGTGNETDSGPMVVLRHPTYTEARPRQDIPIMVFTLEQWGHITGEEWSVGAAPFPPSELARNSRYVFALPARYNYAFPEGWEEVDALLDAGAVQAF